MKDLYALFRQSLAGLRLLVAATLVLGWPIPLVVYRLRPGGRALAGAAARWSPPTAATRPTPKKAVGSQIIGQLVDDPDLFQPRPSAAGDGYDMLSTYGSNYGPEEPDLIEAIKERKAEIAEREGVVRERGAAGRGHRVRLGPRPRHLGRRTPSCRCRGSPRPTGSARTQVRDLVDEHTSGRTWASSASRTSTCCCSTSPSARPQRTPERPQWDDVDRRRGRLTVYLGAAPGVGKTYAMLGEAQRRLRPRHRRGRRVRRDPRPRATPRRSSRGWRSCRAREVDYRGATFTEMDIDAVHRPQARRWCCVDELAHTNVPGSRHEKRAQDVEEIRAAGIDVITTVNIQHLESLNDEVERITGVRQRETVPGRGGPHRRPDPARRHVPRGAAPADGARQHLQAREDRRLAHVVLPGRQPHRAARAGAAVAGRPGRRRARRLPARAPDRGAPGRPRSGSSSRSPAAPRARR